MERATTPRRQTTLALKHGCSVTLWKEWNLSRTTMAELFGSKWVKAFYVSLMILHITVTKNGFNSREIQAPWSPKVCLEIHDIDHFIWSISKNSPCIWLSWCLFMFIGLDSKSPKAKKRVKKEGDPEHTDKKKVKSQLCFVWPVMNSTITAFNTSFVSLRLPRVTMKANQRQR